MKKLPIFLLICLLIGIVACKETEDYWTQYEQWRETNESWFIEQLGAKDEKGNPIYTKVVPSWDHSIYVLMKYYNDTSLNRDAQSPYQTSTVDVIYKGMLYDGTPFDSSYLRTDSIYRTQVKQNIKGWIIGYGAQYMSSLILPYTTLVFDMKLVDIPGLDKPVIQ